MSDQPSLEELLIQSGKLSWRAKSLAGVHQKLLWRDEASGARDAR